METKSDIIGAITMIAMFLVIIIIALIASAKADKGISKISYDYTYCSIVMEMENE